MSSAPAASLAPKWWHLYIPKLFVVLQQGYRASDFRDDVIAGLTVAIVALPLAMALGIASGTTPDKGLITLIVAGFLISALGGSRFQIGGPTGAFVVVIYNVIEKFGYEGLVIATLMAGAILVVAGLARLGTWIKYIPQPVITGFTAGIAVIIFTSQIKDLFGLQMDHVPGEFFEKVGAFWHARDTVMQGSVLIAALGLGIIIGLRRFAPKIPGFLVAVVFASVLVYVTKMDVPTIGSVFGGIPNTIPAPSWPDGITATRVAELIPSALTIAFLAGVESLLSAVVADGMTGRRHKSNCELVGQGVANCASALFGGMPATGAIARTATNIRSGAKSPVSGMLHAVFVLGFILFLAPLASYIPLAVLASVLVIVAWNMSEHEKFIHLLKSPWGDKAVLLITFALTVAVDLTVAIEVGVIMAAILFMVRMTHAFEMQTHITLVESDVADIVRHEDQHYDMRSHLPEGVEAYQLRGPLFFGVSSRLLDVLDQMVVKPKIFILRMGQVPMIDSSGETALEEFIRRCHRANIRVILTGVQPEPMKIMVSMKLFQHYPDLILTHNFAEGVKRAADLMATEAKE